MVRLSTIQSALNGKSALKLRPASQVMDLERLGSMHQSRLSFMRTLVRRIMHEQWKIQIVHSDLCENGYGTVIYEIKTQNDIFNLVIFSNYLADEERNDRVIASKWDLTMALVIGQVDDEYLNFLRENVPLQESGRVDARVIVLSRANRSARNFNYIVEQLSKGLQPDISRIANVGYLYRTTAVYGSGKLGMADWEKIREYCPDFSRPFAAEMFVCFMLRNFSLLQVEHIAKNTNPSTFRPLSIQIKRYFGIGNSTGLGMAPYLINHPLLINQWITIRELALAEICAYGEVTPKIQQNLNELIQRSRIHLSQTFTEDSWQTNNNQNVLKDLNKIENHIKDRILDWNQFLNWCYKNCVLQTQELMISIILELYPSIVDELENYQVVDESMNLDPSMSLSTFKVLIEEKYNWILNYDFTQPSSTQTFWYRSEDKMEPRLGRCDLDVGKEKQMSLGIAYEVFTCYETISTYLKENSDCTIAQFLISHTQLRGIVRRIQNMAQFYYGEIQANLLDENVLPMHLLRAKLSFFGVSKFDPRSKLWVRNTMFQGAPLLEDIGKPYQDDWFMPIAPAQEECI